MKTNLLPCYAIALAFLLGSVHPAAAQWRPDRGPKDELPPQRLLELQLKPADYELITSLRRQKAEVEIKEMMLDGRALPGNTLKIRGRSSLDYRRKSFTVDLKGWDTIAIGDTVKELGKFYLISMSMDRNYFRNRFAFICLRELGLFPLDHNYVELMINSQPEGLYLMMERPEDYILEEHGASYLMRRTYGEQIDDYAVAEEVGLRTEKAFNKQYAQIIDLCYTLEEEALAEALDQRLDLDAYLRWLAFNYWVKNGDYTDEVFFYATGAPDSARLHPLAWDYDDIFASHPHEGRALRDERLGDRLIFSSESVLDRTIATDPVLYKRYLAVLREVLERFPPERLREILNTIYRELYPYYEAGHILPLAQYDKYGPVDLQLLRTELSQVYEIFLVRRREEILNEKLKMKN
jgi:spore coat protein H